MPSSGRTTNVSGPTTISTQVVAVSGGAVTVTLPNALAGAAYNLTVVPTSGS